jgi:hypothetical protein
VSAFFGGCGKISAIFLSRFFLLPLLPLETPKKRDKKNGAKQLRKRKKKEKQKPHLFVMSPAGLFCFFSCF